MTKRKYYSSVFCETWKLLSTSVHLTPKSIHSTPCLFALNWKLVIVSTSRVFFLALMHSIHVYPTLEIVLPCLD